MKRTIHLSLLWISCLWLGLLGRIWAQPQALMTESIYLQTDRELYWSGSAVFVQLAVVDALMERPTTLSQVAYVELWDHNRRLLNRLPIELKGGKGAGRIDIPATAPTGWLQLRAYTRWMMREGRDNASQQILALINPNEPLPVQEVAEPPLRVRFFPEGGQLLAGTAQRLGVQVMNAWGEGQTLTGFISSEGDSQQWPIQTDPGGFGATEVNLQAGKRYELRWEGEEKGITLPKPAAEGVLIQLNSADPVSIQASFQAVASSFEQLTVEWVKAGLVLEERTLSLESGETKSLSWDQESLRQGPSEIRLRDQAGELIGRRQVPGKQWTPTAAMALLDNQNLQTRQQSQLQLRFQGGVGQVALRVSPSWQSDWVSRSYAFSALDTELAALCQGLSQELPRDTQLILPERYGRLLSGTVARPQPGTTVILSLTGETPHLQYAEPDQAGRFFFTLPKRTGPQELGVIAQQPDGTIGAVALDEWWLPPPESLPIRLAFPEAEIPRLRQELQLWQAEVALQARTPIWATQETAADDPFYAELDERVWLDEFTRFATEETFRELIYPVKVRKKGQSFSLQIYDDQQKEELTDPPLLLLDGLPVFSANELLGVNTKLLERVELLTTGHFLGQRFWGGMIHLVSYRKDGTGYPHQAALARRPWQGFAPVMGWKPVAKEGNQPDIRSLWQWNWLRPQTGNLFQQSLTAPDRLGDWTARLMLLHPEGGVSFRELELKVE